MIRRDRELLAYLGRINQRFGLAVVELFDRQDGGELPADGLVALAEQLERAAASCRSRAAELDHRHRVVDLALSEQAEQAM